MGGPFKVVFYQTVRGDCPATEFLESLDKRVRAKVAKWLLLLEDQGPALPRPYADIVEGPIRELRVSHGRIEVRLLFFVEGRSVVVVTHGFLKKTRTIEPMEIVRAMRARADWLARQGGKT